jgi:hypothetical protein
MGVARNRTKDTNEMTDQSYDTRYQSARDGSGRFGRWLASRPAECWMFFAAGVFLGGFFF